MRSAGPRHGTPCAGIPGGEVNGCAELATRFVLSPGLVAVDHDNVSSLPAMGWVLITFCERHRSPVLRFVRERVGDLYDDALVAEIGALPMIANQMGLTSENGQAVAWGHDPAAAGPVFTNLSVAS